MISDFFIDLIGGIFDFMLGGIPTVGVPDWMTGISGVAGTVFGYANSMGVWFPTGLAFTVMAALVAAWGIAFGIHVARMVVSLFTGGGGKA